MPNNNQSTEKAIVKYQVAIDKNISEGEILWNRYSALLVFNSILISAIGFSYQSSIKLPSIIILSLPIAGLFSCYLWFIVTLRGFQWTEHWIITARKIEEKYLRDDNLELDPISNGKNKRKEVIGWPNTRISSYILISIMVILYLLFLFYALYKNSSVENINNRQQKIIHSKHKYSDWSGQNRRLPF